MYPLTSTNHREELMITLYNYIYYSSRLSIIVLDWGSGSFSIIVLELIVGEWELILGKA